MSLPRPSMNTPRRCSTPHPAGIRTSPPARDGGIKPPSRHCEPTGRREAPPDDRLREAIHLSSLGENGLLRFTRNDGKSSAVSIPHQFRAIARQRRGDLRLLWLG